MQRLLLRGPKTKELGVSPVLAGPRDVGQGRVGRTRVGGKQEGGEEEEEGDGESTQHVTNQTNPCVAAGSPASGVLSIAQRPRRERLPSLRLAWLLGLRGVLGLVMSQLCWASGYSSVIAHLISGWIYSLLSLQHCILRHCQSIWKRKGLPAGKTVSLHAVLIRRSIVNVS